MDHIWNIRAKTLKLVGENTGDYLHSLVVDKGLLGPESNNQK